MKIFKIKFDSKDPTDRSISVKKGDDFGIAIQIDNQQSQGPSKLLYAGQEVEANKDLIEGYNVFLLKAIKDSTISVKDIDSQVIFTLNILAKDSDVVELGGTGSGGGGESVWQAGEFDYYIDNAISVNNCQKVTITGNDDQVILKGLCDDASYEIKLGNLILNTPKGIQINGTCSNDTPYIGNVNDCGRKTSFIDFSCGCLNLATDSGNCSKNSIKIDTSGICIDAQNGYLDINSSNNLSVNASNVCICAGSVKINSNNEFEVMVNNNKINIDTTCGRNCILIYSSEGSLNTNVKCTTLSSTSTTNIYACTINTCGTQVTTKAVSYCVDVQGYTIFEATDTYVKFGNCQKQLNEFARYYNLYSSAIGPIIDATDTNNNNITFGNAQRYSYINGNCVILSASNYCVGGEIILAPVENGGQGTQISLKSMSTCSGGIASFVLPQCLQFNGVCVNVGARSKVFLTLLSALETTYHNECANDDGNYFNSVVDTVIYNKLTAVFSTK